MLVMPGIVIALRYPATVMPREMSLVTPVSKQESDHQPKHPCVRSQARNREHTEMPLTVVQRVVKGVAHARLHALMWSLWSGSEGAKVEGATSVLRWQGQPGRGWQGPAADVGIVAV